jgi:uncharacterized membrane protein
MKMKNILIFGGLLVFGVVGYIVLNKKPKSTNSGKAERARVLGRPTKATASIKKENMVAR